VLACAPEHPLAGAERITLDRLDGERFVETHPGWAIRVLIDAAFRDAGLTRRIAYEVNEWAMVLDLVAAGVGVALVPDGLDFAVHTRPAARLRLIPLDGVRLERRIDLVLPKGHAATPAARRFLDQVRRSLPAPA
jgi:DNA-binding transcriptional LysR family regulator